MSYDKRAAMEFAAELSGNVREEYTLDKRMVTDQGVKRGLRNADGTGVLAGLTKIGRVLGYHMDDGMRVPEEGKFYYRGIDVADIVEANRRAGTFGYEEVAHLLLVGKLPNSGEKKRFDEVLSKSRDLPAGFNEDVLLKLPSYDVMNKIASSTLALYSYDLEADDNSLENMLRISIELIGRLPILVANAYAVKRHYYDKKSLYIHQQRENLSLAENFLRMIRMDKQYTDAEARLLDTMLVLHAEHGGGNNSAFVCRALASTGTDTYSVISGAIGSLKGPLHGGANRKVMEMFHHIKEKVTDPGNDAQMKDYLAKLLAGTEGDGSGKIYGVGHAVYTLSDPRTIIIKEQARAVAEGVGMLKDFELMESVERVGVPLLMEYKNQTMPTCANVDLYSGLIYGMLGIPQPLYTPLFAIARISGWCAHRIEETMTGGRIMRPAYRAAVKDRAYVPMEERE